MDPLTITTGCVALLGNIAKLSKTISGFVRECRDARTDMDAVQRELTSLSGVLELIDGDIKEHGQSTFPATLAGQIDGIVNNCDGVLSKIAEVLDERGSGGSGVVSGVRWALGRKERVLELRTSLEAHKTSLELALDLVQLNLARETNKNTVVIMSDTQEIRDATGVIAQDTRLMRVDMLVVLDELARLRLQVAQQENQAKGEEENLVLARYLEDMTSYAETVNGDILDIASSPTALDPVDEVEGEPPARLDLERIFKEPKKAHKLRKVRITDEQRRRLDRSDRNSNSSLESLYHDTDFVKQDPPPEPSNDQASPPAYLLEHSSSSKHEMPATLRPDTNADQPHSQRPGVESDSLGNEELREVKETDNRIAQRHPNVQQQLASGRERETSGAQLPGQVSQEVTTSPTSNLGARNEDDGPSPRPSAQDENRRVASPHTQVVNTPLALQKSPPPGQKSPNATQTTRSKVLAFLYRGKHKSTASTSSSKPSTPSIPSPNLNIVAVHYRVGKKIRERTTFVAFQGINLLNNRPVAISFEPRKAPYETYLQDEYETYKSLGKIHGILNVHYYGREGIHNMLITDLYGPSLDDLLGQCNRRFSVKTVVMVAKQMLTRLQSVHEHNLLHRNVAPINFVLGAPGADVVPVIYLIDFRRARRYRDPKTGQHVRFEEGVRVPGTPARYKSLNSSNGIIDSRRDELEALGHIMLYCLRGNLPWQELGNTQLTEVKNTTPIDELCQGYPDEFLKYMSYVRGLGFVERPDYNYLQSLLSLALVSTGEEADGIYDWMKIEAAGGPVDRQQ